jgi:hypothetical protein
MSVQADMVPYHLFKEFYKKAEFIDFVGISTKHFTDCKVIGHCLKELGDYA